MIARSGRLNNLFAALLLVLLGAAWVIFAPTRFGGQAAYVIISGISMEPSFHRGDLAILRVEDDYAIGDVVTYLHPTIGPVIHRIIKRDGSRFVFKGDNNSWIDEYHPTQDELIGKLWIHLPAAGVLVEQLRIPRNMAALVAVMGVMVMTTGTRSVNRRPRRQSFPRSALLNVRFVVGGRAIERAKRPRAAAGAAASGGDLLFVLATIVFAALLLAAFAFTRPLTRSTLEDISYTQTGTWSYSAAAPAGFYDDGAARTGDPVFRRLSNSVAMHFDYQLSADQLADPLGTYRLIAELSDAGGWKRTIELKPTTSFRGHSFAVDGTLDLARIQALIDNFEQQIGTQHPQYTLAVVPEVRIQGRLAGQALSDDFAPRLEFQLDQQELRFQKESGSGLNSLQPVKPGLLKREREQANTIVLLGLALEVARARQIALVVLALALSCGALLALRGRGATGNDEAARIQRKYGPLLIAVRESSALAGALVEVATIDDLARLAERNGRMILHEIEQGASRYVVQDDGVAYCYRVAALGPATEEQSR
jgi:signal peptidase I